MASHRDLQTRTDWSSIVPSSTLKKPPSVSPPSDGAVSEQGLAYDTRGTLPELSENQQRLIKHLENKRTLKLTRFRDEALAELICILRGTLSPPFHIASRDEIKIFRYEGVRFNVIL